MSLLCKMINVSIKGLFECQSFSEKITSAYDYEDFLRKMLRLTCKITKKRAFK